MKIEHIIFITFLLLLSVKNINGTEPCELTPEMPSCGPIGCNDGENGCEQECYDGNGYIECGCISGYQLNNDGVTCSLIPVGCNNNNGGCTQNCNDQGGSIYCTCNPGYALNGDGLTCDLVPVGCSNNNGGCSQTCNDQGGVNFYCSCNPGYQLNGDGLSCDLIPVGCSNNNGGCLQTCNSQGGANYYCSCNPGYQLNGDGLSCDLIPVGCLNNNGGCEQSCNDLGSGNYFCSCGSGYNLNGDSHTCDAVVISNGCLNDNGGCDQNCNDDGAGGVTCSCNTGYNLIGGQCIDINECSISNGGCNQNCENTYGSFECLCDPGFTLNSNGRTCDIISSCSTGNGGCAQNCNTEAGSFTCSCNSGYTLNGDGKNCDDINECSETTNGGCSQNCENNVGGYECICNANYYLQPDGKTCNLINSCQTGNGGCSQNCADIIGQNTFQCSCNQGFTLNPDGKTCDDNNECNLNPSPCTKYSKCSNSIGSYTCVPPLNHYITSVIPSTTTGGVATFIGSFGYDHEDMSFKIGDKDCPIIYISPSLINCTAAPGQGIHVINYTQNGVVYAVKNLYQYQLIGDKNCPNNCTNQGTCNIYTGECSCNDQYHSFDCSIKISNSSTEIIPIPITDITIKDGSTNITNQQTNFQIYFKSLNEISFDGKVIQTFKLQNNWVFDTKINNTIYKFSQTLKNNCKIITTIEEVKKDKEFNFAGTNFNVKSGLIKFTISISNYTYLSHLNTLQLDFISNIGKTESDFNNKCNEKETTVETTNLNESFNYIKISKDNKILNARFINRLESDGKPTFLLSTIKNETKDTIIVQLSLPHCVKQCIIDPDFSVLVSTDFNSECPDESNRKWVIPVAVVVSVVAASTIAIVGFIVYKRNRTNIKIGLFKLRSIRK